MGCAMEKRGFTTQEAQACLSVRRRVVDTNVAPRLVGKGTRAGPSTIYERAGLGAAWDAYKTARLAATPTGPPFAERRARGVTVSCSESKRSKQSCGPEKNRACRDPFTSVAGFYILKSSLHNRGLVWRPDCSQADNRRLAVFLRPFAIARHLGAGDCRDTFGYAGPLGRRFANPAFLPAHPHLAMGRGCNRPQEPRNG